MLFGCYFYGSKVVLCYDVRSISANCGNKLCALNAKEITGACKELFNPLDAKEQHKKGTLLSSQ